MSKSIDERIVQMSFKNDNFQKNVADTMSSLDKLKSSLDMSGAKTKFGELATAANGVKLDGLADQVAGLSAKFDGLKVVAIGALAAIGAKTVDLAVQIGQTSFANLTKSLQDGFNDYNAKITSVQTVMNALGMTADEVGARFNILDQYADDTIYSMGDMTAALAKFSNAGVDLDQSVVAIQGIGNATAYAGQDAGAAALAYRNFSDAISKGYIGGGDWLSLKNTNVITKQFREELVSAGEAMGTLRKEADGTYTTLGNGAQKTGLKFNELFDVMGDTQWADNNTLMATLEKFGDVTTDLGAKASAAAREVKSLPMLMETLAASAGTGWTRTFELILGDVPQAKRLFTLLADEIGAFITESSNARNSQLELWATMGGREALVEAISNAFKALHSILDPITKAFREVFPPSWGATLANISFAIRDFTAGLILSEKASENLGKVFKMVFTGLKFVLDIVSGAFQIFFALVGAGFRLLGSLVGLVTPLIGWLIDIIPPIQSAGESTESFADKITKLINGGIGPLIGWLQSLKVAFSNFLDGLDAENKMQKISQAAQDVAKTIAMVWNVLAKGDFTGNPFFAEDSKFVDVLFRIREGAIAVGEAIGNFFNNIKTSGKTAADIIGNVWDYLKGIAKDAGPAFANMGKAIEKALSGIQIEYVLAAINTGVLLAVGVGVKKMADSIRGIFDNVGDILGSFTGALDGVTGVLEGMQKKLKADTLIRIAGAIGILAISLAILAGIDPDRLASAAVGMGATLGALFVAMKVLDKISEESTSWKDTAKLVLIGVVLIQLATAVTILANAMRIMGQLSWEELLKGLIGLAAAMGALVGAAKIMSGFEKEIIKSAGAMILMATAILALAGAVAIFGNMPLDVLIQGGIAVAVALGVLVGAAVLLNKYAPDMVLSAVGLMAMAAALNMLILPITTLGLLPFDVLLQGMIAVGLMLGGLVLAAQAMSEIAPQMAIAAVGMMAMAVAINLLVAPITILGALSLDTLIQGLFGLAAVLTMLVVAANAMTGAIVGAGAMIVMAGAILILSAAIGIIGSMPLDQVIQGILGIAAGMLIIGGAAALLGLAAPLLLVGAAGLLAVGLAMIMMAGAVVIFAVGLAMLGPALLIASGGLSAFAQVAPKIAEAVPAFLAIGAGLLVFGAGAAVAGAGVLILGAGLAVLGAGLALVGMFGPIGTIALTAFVAALGKMADQMPNLLAFSGVLATLGAATLVLGAGLTLVGVGGLLALVALTGLVPLGALITASFLLIQNALSRLLDQSDKISEISTNFTSLANNLSRAGSTGASAASGFAAMALATSLMGVSATTTTAAVTVLGTMVSTAMAMISASTASTSALFNASMVAMTASLNAFKMGLSASASSIEASARQIGRSVGPAIISEVNGSIGGMSSAGYNVGRAITDGMANGIYSGRSSVTAAAREVASAALAASKRALDINSPSREYFKVGAFTTEGQALGMLSEIDMVTNASEDLGKSAIKALKDSLAGYGGETMLGIDADPVITPVFDLSQLQAGASAINGMLSNPKLNVDGMRDTAVATRDDIQKSDDDRAESYNDQAPIQFTQINNSPKALSNAEIYRRTKNQLSVAKGALTTANAKST